METDYDVIAKAICENEKEHGFSGDGIANFVLPDGNRACVSYEMYELEGYEEPNYDVESSRCGPGGYYGLDVYIMERANVYDDNDDDVDLDIDLMELSCAVTEQFMGDSRKDSTIREYFSNR